jgi:hypothetical protein
MNESSYATAEAIHDLLNTSTQASSRERTVAIFIALACLGAIVSGLLLIGRFLPVF